MNKHFVGGFVGAFVGALVGIFVGPADGASVNCVGCLVGIGGDIVGEFVVGELVVGAGVAIFVTCIT